MAFVVSAFVLLAACFQSSLAAVAVESTATTATTTTASTVMTPEVAPLGIMNPASAVNNMNPVNNFYKSPFIPTDSYYGIDLLHNFPFYMACDCNLADLIDPTVFNELTLVTTRYNQRTCDLQQWERLINIAMPGIDSVNELNMLVSLASSVQREQMRQNLVYGSYSDFCVNYQAAINGLDTTVATASAAVDTVLVRREPQVATATSTTSSTTTVTNKTPWADSPSYYTMQYLMDRALPSLSPELRLDIINSVMANTPAQYWSSAYPLAQQLTSNIRGMVSDMVDISVPSVTVTY